ncbi:hypothetical protein [Halomonas sp. SpR8]|uniref:hypothetical protein n=1 Tax=Halomonas sp. SpR8 TaxID=3050463 RepID=UPI0027E4257B|nr:hypothetical protein [Halomonas sp. SpR8]MDQ7728005.1 hypothetical protein [Halomonas sp. SpR8]
MSGKFKTTWFWASLGKFDVEKGFIFKEKVKKVSHRNVDFDEYAQHLQNAYEQLDSEGYDVVNVVPISMGTSEVCNQSNGNYVGDVGFSITRGAVVVGKKKEG